MFASPALAKPKRATLDQRPPAKTQRTSYSNESRYDSGGYETRSSGSGSSNVEMEAGVGKVVGIHDLVKDGNGTMLAADARFKIGQSAFVPVGLSFWSGEIDLGEEYAAIDGELSMMHIETGIGYAARLSRKLTIPVGVRVGWYELEAKLSGFGQEVTFKDNGKSVTPFLGMNYALTPTVAMGYETRVPILFSNNRDEDKNDDGEKKKKDNSTLSYHLITLNVKI